MTAHLSFLLFLRATRNSLEIRNPLILGVGRVCENVSGSHPCVLTWRRTADGRCRWYWLDQIVDSFLYLSCHLRETSDLMHAASTSIPRTYFHELVYLRFDIIERGLLALALLKQLLFLEQEILLF